LFLEECIDLVTLLSGMLTLWNHHPAPVPAQICNKDNTSALSVYWRMAQRVNDAPFGTRRSQSAVGDSSCSRPITSSAT